MAASSRSGFPGGCSGGDGPTDVQSARTLYGHDLHLEPGSVDTSPANQISPPDEAPVDSRPVTTEEEFTAPVRVPSHHSGKSRLPALAKLFGRWNTRGQFEHTVDDDDDLDVVPRERFLRPLAIVVATSAISFFIVVALLKLRDSTAPAPPELPAATLVSPPTPPPVAPRPAPPAAAAVPPPAPRAVPERARPISDVLERAIAQREATRAPAKRAAPRRPRPRQVVPIDPDSPMPLSF